jgi:hypothetical protein
VWTVDSGQYSEGRRAETAPVTGTGLAGRGGPKVESFSTLHPTFLEIVKPRRQTSQDSRTSAVTGSKLIYAGQVRPGWQYEIDCSKGGSYARLSDQKTRYICATGEPRGKPFMLGSLCNHPLPIFRPSTTVLRCCAPSFVGKRISFSRKALYVLPHQPS